MSQLQTFLFTKDHQKLSEVVRRLQSETSAQSVFLFDRDGRQLAATGNTEEFDITSFASLAAGNVAATEALARMVGEQDFPSQFHEGASNSIYLSSVGRHGILVVLFDKRASVGLVRLRVKRTLNDLLPVLSGMTAVPVSPPMADFLEIEEPVEVLPVPSPLPMPRVTRELTEITDEEIESLFH